MRCRTKWTEAVTITWHSQERYCRYGTLHFVDLLWSYNRVLHYTPQIPTGSHLVSIMHKTSEMSECCRESPCLPLTSIFGRFSVYRWRTDRCWAWKAQVSVLVVCTLSPPSHNDPHCRCFQVCHADNQLNEEWRNTPGSWAVWVVLSAFIIYLPPALLV